MPPRPELNTVVKSLFVRACVLLSANPSTDFEAVSASVRARKSAQPPHFLEKPGGAFQFANRCLPRLLTVDLFSFGGSLVSQREPTPTAGICAQSPHTRHDAHDSHTQDHILPRQG